MMYAWCVRLLQLLSLASRRHEAPLYIRSRAHPSHRAKPTQVVAIAHGDNRSRRCAERAGLPRAQRAGGGCGGRRLRRSPLPAEGRLRRPRSSKKAARAEGEHPTARRSSPKASEDEAAAKELAVEAPLRRRLATRVPEL